MQKNNKLLLSLLVIVIISAMMVSNASAAKSKKSDPFNQLLQMITSLQDQVNAINAKLTTTVSLGNSTTTSPSTKPPLGTHEHPFTKVSKPKHVVNQSDGNKVKTTSTSPLLSLGDIPPECKSINVGNATAPDYRILDWCPSSHQLWYFINDTKATPTSLGLTQITKAPVTESQGEVNAPLCSITQEGTFQFADGPITGFVLECDQAHDQPVANEQLVYALVS